MPSVICASALRADSGVSGVLALVFTARTYVVHVLNVKFIIGWIYLAKRIWRVASSLPTILPPRD
jgi:hypothetical protein